MHATCSSSVRFVEVDMFIVAMKSLALGMTLIASGPPMPDRSVDKMCGPSSTGPTDQASVTSCRDDERLARDGLMKEWDGVPAQYRTTCLSSINDVSPSFVALKSCIDNNIIMNGAKK